MNAQWYLAEQKWRIYLSTIDNDRVCDSAYRIVETTYLKIFCLEFFRGIDSCVRIFALAYR